MAENVVEEMVVVGSGPAGCTAALYGARSGRKPLWIAGGVPGGLLGQIAVIDNYPGFAQGISGYDLSDQMCQQAENAGARMTFELVKEAEFAPLDNRLTLSNGQVVVAKSVILALGTRHSPLQVPGEVELTGHGVSYCAVCDGAFFRGQTVAVVGGGDMALEEALLLANLASEVHVIHRGSAFGGTAAVVEKVLNDKRIVVHFGCRVSGLQGVAERRLSGVEVTAADGSKEVLPCTGLFVATGKLLPNTDFLQKYDQLLDENGYIKLLDRQSCSTALPGVFAAGDCACPQYRQVVIAAGMGASAAMAAVTFLNRT